ncbi:hypothetical protein M0R45_028376 [Rubus argutus]|uniref:Uncharacterized protein n=1 Tax=Rubus argutus TaxID=59490 RepID=A0AAW1W8K0_RUBAR
MFYEAEMKGKCFMFEIVNKWRRSSHSTAHAIMPEFRSRRIEARVHRSSPRTSSNLMTPPLIQTLAALLLFPEENGRKFWCSVLLLD